MFIGGFQKCSLMDYPEKISCIIFTQGCNFRCPYCHNPELTEISSNSIDKSEILNFLQKRKGKLDAVVITGGEPTLQKSLIEFMTNIKELDYLIKLDTNGTNPQALEEIINSKLVDYIAMDIKSPIEKYQEITCSKTCTNSIKKSINLIKNSGIKHEFRTTIVKEQLNFNDIQQIAILTKGSKHYFQKFVASKHVDESYKTKTTYSDEEFQNISLKLKQAGLDFELRS